MALIFMDGFDKYGSLNAAAGAYLLQEWSTASAACAIVDGLSSPGSALSMGNSLAVNKNLGANYSRLIGGFRFSSNLGSGSGGITFSDAATAQATITINSTGTISVRNGGVNGTAIATSAVSVSANSVHYLEFDITFSNTGAYQIWLDGVSILSGSGDTTATANNFANAAGFTVASGTTNEIFDDYYLFDTTGSINNAPLLTSPRIETQFPNSDAAVQFAFGAATLGVGGTTSRQTTAAQAGLAACLFLRPLTSSRACTLNSISFTPLFNNAAANFRVCVYADSAGVPGALMGSSGTITGATNGTTITGALTTPPSLTAGTQYWLGFISDAGNSNIASAEGSNTGRYASNTFASGPPSTAPAMSVGSSFTPNFWGNVTLSSPVNFYEVGQRPASGNLSYVFDATVAHEDLYGFPALSTPPTTIHGVAVRAYVAKSDSGAKTVSVRCKSGATDSAGSVASFSPSTTYAWLSNYFATDPATAAPWTLSGLNAAQAGLKVET